MKIIGVCGFAGSGKNTVASMISNKGYSRINFANGVKDITAVMFNWPRNMLEGDTSESRNWRELPDKWWSDALNYELSPRKALQLIGTEVGRDLFHPDFWVIQLFSKLADDGNYVISDVRFPNEIDRILDSGGKIILVKRGPNPSWYDVAYHDNRGTYPVKLPLADGHVKYEHMELDYPDIHYSEWAWIGKESQMHLIENDGTLEDLENKVNIFMETMNEVK